MNYMLNYVIHVIEQIILKPKNNVRVKKKVAVLIKFGASIKGMRILLFLLLSTSY